MTFGEKLSKLRKENNYTQEQLADALNVSRQSVSKWESNIAYPETDKLICLARLFECSTDYLLKDECISKNVINDAGITESNSTVKGEYPTRHQKIIGYIFLTVSLIAGILVLILAESAEELYVPVPIISTILSCGLICLFVKRKAGYWCAWSIAAPIAFLTPHLVGLSALNGINLILISFYIIMFFVAKKVFGNKEISTSRKKSSFVIVGWFALIGVRIFSYISFKSVIIESNVGFIPFMLMNLLVYAGISLLMTYTVCYLKNLKRGND